MEIPFINSQNNNLKIFRELNNYTQKYVGEDVLGVSQNTYSRLEKNPKRLTKDQAEKLCDLYNINISQLLSNENPIVSFHNNTIDKAFIQNYYETQKELIDNLIIEKDKQINDLKLRLDKSETQLYDLMNKLVGKI